MREGVGNCFGLHEGAPDGAAQVRRIKAAENAVPVSVIALATKQKAGGLIASLLERPGAVLSVVSERGELFRDAQHFFVHQVRFGIFGEKAAPKSTAQKGRDVGASGEFRAGDGKWLAQRSAAPTPSFPGRKRWADRRGRAEDARRWRQREWKRRASRGNSRARRRNFEPAVRVAKRVSAGPAAEFFEIVAHGGDAARMRAGLLPRKWVVSATSRKGMR